MKKWLLISCIVIMIIFTFFTNVYFNAMEPIKDARKKALRIIEEKTSLISVEDFFVYNGTESYYIVKGKNNKSENLIVWINEKNKNVIVKKEKDGITKQDAINYLLTMTDPKKIISVRLGMEKNIPLWEIYYRSEGDLMNYFYVDFETGERLKRIENL